MSASRDTPPARPRPASTVRRQVARVALEGDAVEVRARADRLATEEPLEIRIAAARGATLADGARQVAVTMRTPGADFELAVGFLFAEGILNAGGQVAEVRYCTEAEQRYNVVNVVLTPAAAAEVLPRVGARAFAVTSACGVCGTSSIQQALGERPARVADGLRVSPARIVLMPQALRAAQAVFERTGGLHAAALFTGTGELLRIREDVGRHNALDKLVGSALLAGELPLADRVVMVSGRLSFELVQKAARAGVQLLAGVSAPSSLAVETAEAAGMTLIGFLRENRFNVYAGDERVLPPLAS